MHCGNIVYTEFLGWGGKFYMYNWGGEGVAQLFEALRYK